VKRRRKGGGFARGNPPVESGIYSRWRGKEKRREEREGRGISGNDFAFAYFTQDALVALIISGRVRIR
jgi:hypothetical protein